MTTRKHNDFLDIAASDDEASGSDRGYDSEANAAESKGRAVKRRRTTTTQDFSPESDEDEDEDEEEDKTSEKEDEDNEDEEGGASLEDSTKPSTKSAKSLKAKGKLAKLSKLANGKAPKKTRSGVIYFSSLPPYLKPFALKAMLEKRGFGGITKIFLAPLLPSAAGHRSRSNKRKLYTEGWIEFESKKTAKICAETLNATIVGGLKSSCELTGIFTIIYVLLFCDEYVLTSATIYRVSR